MAVVALLHLKHESALPLESRAAVEKRGRDWITAPGVHDRTPRRMLSQVCERCQRNRHQQNCEYSNGPAPPALLAFAEKKWQENQGENPNHGTDEQCGSFHGGWQ